MCGLSGILSISLDRVDFQKFLPLMLAALEHRGPDSNGFWVDPISNLGLCHTRLSILDTSDMATQPMLSHNKNSVLVFNGEIYNHHNIRRTLDESSRYSIPWHSSSDTETLLVALEHWGITKTLDALDGMFAFAIWNRSEKSLILARDRFGEKPLYYGYDEDRFWFGSDLRPLLSCLPRHPEINLAALNSYLQYSYVPNHQCIFDGYYKLKPGHYLVLRESDFFNPVVNCYYNLSRRVFEARSLQTPVKSHAEYVEELDIRLKKTVSSRMLSDVPIGAFLSGGIDSSLISAIAQNSISSPLNTFTIGFDEAEYNEAFYAKEVARHLNCNHTELYASAQDCLASIPKVASAWSEPFGDSSQFPTFLLSQLTKKHVTVALSGDGGDEVFCGYNRYLKGYKLYRRMKKLPAFTSVALNSIFGILSPNRIESLVEMLPQKLRYKGLSKKIPKLLQLLTTKNDNEYFHMAQCLGFTESSEVILPANFREDCDFDKLDYCPKDFVERMMMLDTTQYLPGDILTKVDRASMAASLEVRAPFLSHDLVEFAWSIPLSLKTINSRPKALLTDVLASYVPHSLFDRPKHGFGAPINHWLHGPLKSWASELLNDGLVCSQGLLDSNSVTTIWNSYLSSPNQNYHQVWNLLMLQSWLLSINYKSP